MKKIALLLAIVMIAASFTSCGESKETLKVYNVGQYIDKSTISDFEKEYNVKVVYDEFNTNEELYAKISKDQDAYDIVVPSDYTIDRLIQEDMLAEIDKSNIPNFSELAEEYLAPEYDPDNKYSIPYMVGTLGIIYNKTMVYETPDSWGALWDPKYKDQIFIWDSMRDAIGPTLKYLGYSMNSNNDKELNEAKQKLIDQRPLIQAYVGDEIRDKMIAGEGALGIIYSGDAVTAIEEESNLAYILPKEGSNKWVDGFVILKTTKHKDLAEKFIDFMCRPDIAERNMTETGYTSPVKAAWSAFPQDDVRFPSAAALANCEAFTYSKEATQKYSDMWTEIKASK